MMKSRPISDTHTASALVFTQSGDPEIDARED
jgi:hypothetical protein